MPCWLSTLRTAPFHTHSLLDAAATESVATPGHRAGLLHGVTADAALCYCLHCRYLLVQGCVVFFDELLLAPLESLVCTMQLVVGSTLRIVLILLFTVQLVVGSTLRSLSLFFARARAFCSLFFS